MQEPNFILGGAVAAGTSFLSHSIKDHPEIYLPKIMRPECGFFYKSWEFEKGKDYYLRQWFSDVRDEKAVGERSSLYLYGLEFGVAERISKMFPDMKFIFCLRNPVERAYANYRFTALTGFETLSFSEALKREDERKRSLSGWMREIQPYAYRERGVYYEQLQPFYENFPAENILCIESKQLARDTEAELKKVYRFLAVSENFVANEQSDHSSPNVRSVRFQYCLRKLIGTRLDEITENFRKEKSESFLARLVALNLTEGKQPMGDDERLFLNEFYEPNNARLADFLNWNLTEWK